MGKGKGSIGVRWVGDASLIAENKSATNQYTTENDQGNPHPKGGESPGIGLGKASGGSMSPAGISGNKPKGKGASKSGGKKGKK